VPILSKVIDKSEGRVPEALIRRKNSSCSEMEESAVIVCLTRFMHVYASLQVDLVRAGKGQWLIVLKD
jgi:uncharacterized circularly permuted ATP-grasp superfamily protein